MPFLGTHIWDIYNSDMQNGSPIICSIYSFQSFLSHEKAQKYIILRFQGFSGATVAQTPFIFLNEMVNVL